MLENPPTPPVPGVRLLPSVAGKGMGVLPRWEHEYEVWPIVVEEGDAAGRLKVRKGVGTGAAGGAVGV